MAFLSISAEGIQGSHSYNDKNIISKQLFSLGYLGVGCFSQSVGYVALLTVHIDLQFLH